MLRLIIKASPEDAAEQLKARDLTPLSIFKALSTDLGSPLTAVDVEDSALDYERVLDWFCEASSAPFPNGTLMLYQQNDLADLI